MQQENKLIHRRHKISDSKLQKVMAINLWILLEEGGIILSYPLLVNV